LFQPFIAASEPSNNTLTGLKSIQNGFHKKLRDDFALLWYFHLATNDAAFLALLL
jgi:hypothetical protein